MAPFQIHPDSQRGYRWPLWADNYEAIVSSGGSCKDEAERRAGI